MLTPSLLGCHVLRSRAALAVEPLDVFDDRFGFIVVLDDDDLPPDP